jgi:hypothetical protein
LRRAWGEYRRLREERARLKVLVAHQLYGLFPEFLRVWADLLQPGALAVLRTGLTSAAMAAVSLSEFVAQVREQRAGRRVWRFKLAQVHRYAAHETRWEPCRGVIPELLLDRTAQRGRHARAHGLDKTLIARGVDASEAKEQGLPSSSRARCTATWLISQDGGRLHPGHVNVGDIERVHELALPQGIAVGDQVDLGEAAGVVTSQRSVLSSRMACLRCERVTWQNSSRMRRFAGRAACRYR